MTVIDEYLKKLEPGKLEPLLRIRSLAKMVVPDLEEAIVYGMPTLKYLGTCFLGFNALKNHIGIYPYGGEEIEVFKKQLVSQNYKFSTGAIQIGYDQMLSEELLKAIIRHRIERIARKS